MTKQEIVYNNGNVIEQGEIIDYRKGRYKKTIPRRIFRF